MDRIHTQFETGAMFKEENIENIGDTLIDNAAYSLMYLWYLYEKSQDVRDFVNKLLEKGKFSTGKDDGSI